MKTKNKIKWTILALGIGIAAQVTALRFTEGASDFRFLFITPIMALYFIIALRTIWCD